MIKTPVYGSPRKARLEHDRLEILRHIPPEERKFLRNVPEGLEYIPLTRRKARYNEAAPQKDMALRAMREGKTFTYICDKGEDYADYIYSSILHRLHRNKVPCNGVRACLPDGRIQIVFYPSREAKREALRNAKTNRNPKNQG